MNFKKTDLRVGMAAVCLAAVGVFAAREVWGGDVAVVPGSTVVTNAERVDVSPAAALVDSHDFVPPGGMRFKNLNVDAQGHEIRPERYADIAPDNLFTGSLTTNRDVRVKVQWLHQGVLPAQTADQWIGHVSGKIVTPKGAAYGVRGEDKKINNEWKADVKANIGPPKIVSHTVAAWPVDHTRLKIGVGEVVELKLQPLPIGVNPDQIQWKITKGQNDADLGPGKPPFSGESISLIARDHKAKEVAVQVSWPNGGEDKITFEIVEPQTIASAVIYKTMHRKPGVPGVGMHLYPIVVGPTEVSFDAVSLQEGVCHPTERTGCFDPANDPNNANPPSHIEGAGAKDPFDLAADNTWPKNFDQAYMFEDKNYQIVTQQKYASGSFQWKIPVIWRVRGYSKQNSWPEKLPDTGNLPLKARYGWIQKFEVVVGEDKQKRPVTEFFVKKFGQTQKRTLQDVATPDVKPGK